MIKVITKYKYIQMNILNYIIILMSFSNLYSKMDNNTNINNLKNNIIKKNLREMVEKNGIRITDGYIKVSKKIIQKSMY